MGENNEDYDNVNALASMFALDVVLAVKEFGVVVEDKPMPEEGNSKIVHIHEDCVGISSWALPQLYEESKKRLKISKRHDLNAATVAILANPDFATAWAVRKEFFQRASFKSELHFCYLVLGRSPKSSETWAHRAWLLRCYGWSADIVEKEFAIARKAASRVKSNYYAGVHRLKTLKHASRAQLCKELAENRLWLQTHIGDSSGWWYHRTVLEYLRPLNQEQAYSEDKFIADMSSRYGSQYESVRKQFMYWTKNAKRFASF